jgi:Spy/CpxP family protein refolding chaperone
MRVVSTMLALVVSLWMVGNLAAQDKKAPEGKRQHGAPMAWDMLRGLNLSDAQKAQVKDVKKDYEPKLKQARDSVLTPEQIKAREEALKTAKAAGKKGKEVWQAVEAAMKVTDDQKAKMAKAVEPLRKEVSEKVMAILTPEQLEKFKQAKPHKRGNRSESE